MEITAGSVHHMNINKWCMKSILDRAIKNTTMEFRYNMITVFISTHCSGKIRSITLSYFHSVFVTCIISKMYISVFGFGLTSWIPIHQWRQAGATAFLSMHWGKDRETLKAGCQWYHMVNRDRQTVTLRGNSDSPIPEKTPRQTQRGLMQTLHQNLLN